MIYWTSRKAGRLHCGGLDLSLTPFQCFIIDKLLTAGPDGVSRERLIETIYAGAQQPERPDKVVQILICRMRQLGIPIQTVMIPGAGGGNARYVLESAAKDLHPGDHYSNGKGPGTWVIRKVITDQPVVVLYNALLKLEQLVPIKDLDSKLHKVA